MANRKITELNALTGANATDTDVFAIVDISADETKKMTLGELKEAFDTGSGFVRITGDTMTGDLTVPNVVVSGNVDGRDVSADGTKLDGIEAGATADQTAAEIRSLVESATDSNVFTDADHSKLNGIEAGATADQTAAEIKTAYESNANTNEFSDAEQTKLAGIEAGADVTDTANVTSAGALMDSELTDIAAVKALNQGVATTDDPTFTNTQLAAIASTISDTAVDIFVYDTRKDSDGGAWRKRTQGTSWYNETLNTATRGSRKEFPAVAVIVAESNQVTIYDGDDPDLPMWMVFNQGIQYQIYTNGNSLSSIQMLNGKLCWAGFRMGRIDFIKDASDALELSYYVKFTSPISGRNTANYSYEASAFSIVNNSTNDVAMTVLPNAPIDPATGLPVPTIAVACGTAGSSGGGVSVIKDDGTVVDLTASTAANGYASYSVAFTSDNKLITSQAYGGSYSEYHIHPAIPSSDQGISHNAIRYRTAETSGISVDGTLTAGANYAVDKGIEGTKDGFSLAFNNVTAKLTQVLRDDEANPLNQSIITGGAVNYITSDYNTGWMNGAIKLATLSDTDDTDVTGSELVTNGTFDSDTSGWTAGGPYTPTLSVESGRLKVTSTNATDHTMDASQTITTVVGKTYVFTGDVQNNGCYYAGFAVNDPATYSPTRLNDNGLYTDSLTFTATTTSTTIRLRAYTTQTGHSAYADNISVRLAEEDRSVNGNGLQVFGTVTKSAVATGADLVAYSGFSSSNYLAQPYNSDLDFGTGDFCFMCWAKVSDSAGNEPLIYRTNYNDGWGSTAIRLRYSVGAVQFTITDDAFSTTDQCSVSGQANGVWQHLAGVRRGNTIELWLDGKLGTSTAITNATGSLNNSDAILHIGTRQDLASTLSGSIALTRISATAPSPDQILKIYNDEKHLFTEGAQATLYGSSDSVTALAYDTDSELLHVGTSAGRSVFQGLRRVDNTTTAVTSAISASNGLVADE